MLCDGFNASDLWGPFWCTCYQWEELENPGSQNPPPKFAKSVMVPPSPWQRSCPTWRGGAWQPILTCIAWRFLSPSQSFHPFLQAGAVTLHLHLSMNQVKWMWHVKLEQPFSLSKGKLRARWKLQSSSPLHSPLAQSLPTGMRQQQGARELCLCRRVCKAPPGPPLTSAAEGRGQPPCQSKLQPIEWLHFAFQSPLGCELNLWGANPCFLLESKVKVIAF